MIIKMSTLLQCKDEDLLRLAKHLEIKDAESQDHGELATSVFHAINNPMDITPLWLSHNGSYVGNWRKG